MQNVKRLGKAAQSGAILPYSAFQEETELKLVISITGQTIATAKLTKQ